MTLDGEFIPGERTLQRLRTETTSYATA